MNAYEFEERFQSAVEDSPEGVDSKIAVANRYGDPSEIHDVYWDADLEAVVVEYL